MIRQRPKNEVPTVEKRWHFFKDEVRAYSTGASEGISAKAQKNLYFLTSFKCLEIAPSVKKNTAILCIIRKKMLNSTFCKRITGMQETKLQPFQSHTTYPLKSILKITKLC